MSLQAVTQTKGKNQNTISPGGILQRKCTCGNPIQAGGECTECRKKRLALQRKATNRPAEPATAPPIVHEVLRSPGRPLDDSTRSFMESRFGHDFSRVKVHAGEKAASSARDVDAMAYTVGQNIVFGAGQYMPRTVAGQHLIAHELVHTLQQGSGRNTVQKNMLIGSSSHPAEVEADRIADSVLAGGMAPTIQHRSGGLQRRDCTVSSASRPNQRNVETSVIVQR